MSFKSLGLSNSMVELLEKHLLKDAYPIQEKVIPLILNDRDVLGIAKTGSGKTLGFVLPILTNIGLKSKNKNRHIDVLILVPTRELAIQVLEVVQTYSPACSVPIKSLAVYGGVSINPQMIALQNVNILVATSGRLLDLISSKALSLESIKTFVLDEADKMLNLGFEDQMNEIYKLLPKQRQNLLFSATLSKDIDSIQNILLNNPETINIEEKNADEDFIEQEAYFVSEERKGPLLRYIIKHNKLKQVLVFTSSVYKADKVAEKLRKNGIRASAIHSKKSQGARTEALEKFKENKIRVLVATDLLSRGIDINNLAAVINYELPRSPKDFIHRIGRTGRAESKGKAYSLITDDSWHHFKVIQKKMKVTVEMVDSDTMDLHGF